MPPASEYQWSLCSREGDLNLEALKRDLKSALAITRSTQGKSARSYSSLLRIGFDPGFLDVSGSMNSLKPEYLRDNVVFIPPSIVVDTRSRVSKGDPTKGTLLVQYELPHRSGLFRFTDVSRFDDGTTIMLTKDDPDGKYRRGLVLKTGVGLQQTRTPDLLSWHAPEIEQFIVMTTQHSGYKSQSLADKDISLKTQPTETIAGLKATAGPSVQSPSTYDTDDENPLEDLECAGNLDEDEEDERGAPTDPRLSVAASFTPINR